MRPSIKLFLSASALILSSSAAFAQSVATGALSASSPTFHRPEELNFGGNCVLDDDATDVAYKTYTIAHPGGPLELSLDADEWVDEGDLDPFLGLYSGAFTAANACINAIAYNDDGGDGFNSKLSLDLASGTYTVVATSYANEEFGTYTLTSSAPIVPSVVPSNATPVPVAGVPALALMGLGLFGAACATRRRKVKVPQA